MQDVKRICIPALGSGRYNMPVKQCAKLIVGACMDWFQSKFQKKEEISIEGIRFCNKDKETVEAFINEFN
jgi:O-acetyl-ADP-ribose deacetylase (regulator of RNase III)